MRLPHRGPGRYHGISFGQLGSRTRPEAMPFPSITRELKPTSRRAMLARVAPDSWVSCCLPVTSTSSFSTKRTLSACHICHLPRKSWRTAPRADPRSVSTLAVALDSWPLNICWGNLFAFRRILRRFSAYPSYLNSERSPSGSSVCSASVPTK